MESSSNFFVVKICLCHLIFVIPPIPVRRSKSSNDILVEHKKNRHHTYIVKGSNMTDNKSLEETASSSALKRNNADDDNEVTTKKRPKVSVDSNDIVDDAKTIVTPTMATATTQTAATSKAATTSISRSTSTATSTETIDIAETLGLKTGDRIEVQWEIHNDVVVEKGDDDDSKKIAATTDKNNDTGTDDNDKDNEDDGDVTVTVHWWKATVLEHDGRTTDSVAIRSLLYDARPDLGFPEISKEDVVFMGHDILVPANEVDSADWENDPDAVSRMPFRRVDNGEEVTFYNDDDLEEQLNSILMGAFNKNQQQWRNMPASQQAVIAEMINMKKEELKRVIKEEAKHKVITSETIKEILARTF